MSESVSPGRVYLVGAGPGDPGLLTLRAVECLRLADFVLYDYLASPRALDFARPEAERFRVTQLPGTHPERWQLISEKIIAEARKGKSVVHLKGGDPLVFGRGAEEAELLRAAGVPYEIVPGVTAAFAAAAGTEIPLTHRTCASAVALVTGHEDPGKGGTRLDWDALVRFPGTLAIYMGVTQLGHITQELVGRGMDPETPATLVYRASTGEQRSVIATIGRLEESVRASGLTRPSLVLIGPVVELRPERSWFESRPLFGMRVVVTRPRQQALPLVRRLEQLGAVPYVLPTVAIAPPADWSPVDTAIAAMRNSAYDWAVFTSANGVMGFFARLRTLGLDSRSMGRTRLAAIGTGTAASLAEFHLLPDLIAGGDMSSEVMADQLMSPCRGGRVLLVQAAEGRALLRDRLGAVATVDPVAVYRQVPVVDPTDPVHDRLRRGEIDAVTLTSPNIGRAFLEACDETVRSQLREGSTRLVVNSERLRGWLQGEDLPSLVSPDPTSEGLIAALEQLWNDRRDR